MIIVDGMISQMQSDASDVNLTIYNVLLVQIIWLQREGYCSFHCLFGVT